MASLLHLLWIGSHSFWFDELFTAASAEETTIARAFEQWYLIDLTNPPLYNVLVFLHGRLFGTSELALRLPSWLLVTASCLYLGFSPFSDDVRTRRLAGLILAVSPLSFVYSQEARAYALLLFASTLVQTAYLRFSREQRVSTAFACGAILSSATHFFGLFFAGLLVLLAFLSVLRRRAFGEAAKLIAVGVACWSWVLFIVWTGRTAGLVAPFWIDWSWSMPLYVLMHLGSLSIGAVALAALWQGRSVSPSLLQAAALPALVFFGLMILLSTYRFLLLGRYFIVLAPAMAMLSADLLTKGWDAMSRRVSASTRAGIVALVIAGVSAENAVWMFRQKWGPYQNYRGVAESIARDVLQSADGHWIVSIVLPFTEAPVRVFEQRYLRRVLRDESRVELRLIEETQLEHAALDSNYIVAMHRPETVSKARTYVTNRPDFVEIDIPTNHKSMTFLAKRVHRADATPPR